MSSNYIYKCTACNYKEQVSGGKDRGKLVSTETMTCPDCLRLVDTVTAIACDPELAARMKVDIAKQKGRCCHCGGLNLLPWKAQACPKCGGKMEKLEGGPVRMWD